MYICSFLGVGRCWERGAISMTTWTMFTFLPLSLFFFFEGAAVYVRETEKEREGTFVCVNARMLVPLCMREREQALWVDVCACVPMLVNYFLYVRVWGRGTLMMCNRNVATVSTFKFHPGPHKVFYVWRTQDIVAVDRVRHKRTPEVPERCRACPLAPRCGSEGLEESSIRPQSRSVPLR